MGGGRLVPLAEVFILNIGSEVQRITKAAPGPATVKLLFRHRSATVILATVKPMAYFLAIGSKPYRRQSPSGPGHCLTTA